jgi:hypothetical protein
MALPSSGQISMQDILEEKNGGSITATDISLRGLSVNSVSDYGAIDITINSASTNKPDQAEPHQMSEFHGYDHSASSVVHSSTLTNGNTGGYGFALNGYQSQGATTFGSMGDTTLTLNGRARTIDSLYSSATSSTATSGSIILFISDDLGTTSSNAGFTSMKIYLNQANNSGTPDLTLNRTSATYTGTTATMSWSWSVSVTSPDSVYNTYFGGSTAQSNFIELV